MVIVGRQSGGTGLVRRYHYYYCYSYSYDENKTGRGQFYSSV